MPSSSRSFESMDRTHISYVSALQVASLSLMPFCPLVSVISLISLGVWLAAAAAAESLQSCPTLCDPIDGIPPGKNTGVGCHFLLQCMKGKSLSRARLLATPWTAAYQAPPPMGFSRQEYWSGVPVPSLGHSLRV